MAGGRGAAPGTDRLGPAPARDGLVTPRRCPRVAPRVLPDPARGETLLDVAAVMAFSQALHAGAVPGHTDVRLGRVAHYAGVDALGFGEWVLDVLAAEARALIGQRPPDQVIRRVGRPYLERWWLRRGVTGAVYLHRWLGDDPDFGLHDHPADSLSLLLTGALRERWLAAGDLPDHCISEVRLARGAVTYRTAACAHQIYIDSPRVEPLTLFVFGPRAADAAWGFWVPSPDGAGRKVRERHPSPPGRYLDDDGDLDSVDPDWECPQCGLPLARCECPAPRGPA